MPLDRDAFIKHSRRKREKILGSWRNHPPKETRLTDWMMGITTPTKRPQTPASESSETSPGTQNASPAKRSRQSAPNMKQPKTKRTDPQTQRSLTSFFSTPRRTSPRLVTKRPRASSDDQGPEQESQDPKRKSTAAATPTVQLAAKVSQPCQQSSVRKRSKPETPQEANKRRCTRKANEQRQVMAHDSMIQLQILTRIPKGPMPKNLKRTRSSGLGTTQTSVGEKVPPRLRVTRVTVNVDR